MNSDEKTLQRLYDGNADNFLFTRTEEKGITGFFNREIEQPIIFDLVPQNLTGKKLLDVGCGPGIHLKQYIGRGAEGFGVDLSPKMIDLAQKHCSEGNFKVGSVSELDYVDDSFDIITSSLMLDHVENLDGVFKELKRVLKDGGLLIFSAPHPVSNMFRDNEDGKFVPTHNYFDRNVLYCNIAGGGKEFIDFPRTIQDYLEVLLKNNFILEKFVESEPLQEWKEKYPELEEWIMKIPFFCFFKLKISK
ncbi:class I SAM-dependent methyltransferase [Candidatus Woesearchaeota archaeon]|jgi:ubiquinone/menaquinone biosynthesis C-methylase UbiE|nr:class I SAM-dependent methyltransferase [Candidatus Woesearchaeota archaeon]MBT6045007.1 class I SAM-dependent methyltransferase [Candidatus Woesearchaeota archaeon]